MMASASNAEHPRPPTHRHATSRSACSTGFGVGRDAGSRTAQSSYRSPSACAVGVPGPRLSGCCYCSYLYHGGMAIHSLTTSLDPSDPAIRSDAKHLAERLDGDSPLETAIRAVLDEVAHGARVVVLRTEDEITPAQAAEILGVTRQFVDRLCEGGVLAFRRLPHSRHRRIRIQDVLEVAEERERRRTGSEAIRAALVDADT